MVKQLLGIVTKIICDETEFLKPVKEVILAVNNREKTGYNKTMFYSMVITNPNNHYNYNAMNGYPKIGKAMYFDLSGGETYKIKLLLRNIQNNT